MSPVRVSKATLWKAIRHRCLECCYGSKNEVLNCTCDDCPLYPLRLGEKTTEHPPTANAPQTR